MKMSHKHMQSSPPSTQHLWLALGIAALSLASLASNVEAREIRVGVYENAPKIFTNANGNPDGIFINLLQAIAAQEDWQLSYVYCEWNACLQQLAEGAIDLMPDVAQSPQRQRLFDFHTTPALHSWSQIYTRMDKPIDDLADLNGKQVAVVRGSIQDKAFKELADGYDLKVDIVEVNSFDEAFQLVHTGKAVAAVTNHYFGEYNAANYGLQPSHVVFQPTNLYFATTQGRNSELLATIDNHLRVWQQDKEAEYYKILMKWSQHSTSTLSPFFKQALLFLVGLLVLVAIMAAILKWQLRSKAKQLITTRNKLQATLDALPDLLFEIDQDGRYLDYHSPRTELLAAPPEVLIGHKLQDVLPEDAVKICMDALQEAAEKGFSQGKQIVLDLPDATHWFELSVSRKTPEKNQPPTFIVLSRDITPRKMNELQLARMTKLYAALSQCNQAIVRCTNEDELFSIICRDAVNFGGMRMAWMGLLDEVSGQLQPVSSFGEGIEYLEGIEISLDASQPQGRGPTGTAMREDRPYWCQDFQHDPATRAWHERAARFGWAASASIPLHRKDQVVGAISLYADAVNAFDENAQNLLLEMAMDISYALDSFADDALLKRTAAELAEKDALYRTAFYTSPDSININRLSDGMYLNVNEGFEQLTGWKHEEVVGKTSREINIWQSYADRTRLVEALQRDGYCENLEANFTTKHGTTIQGLMSAKVISIKGEPCILNITRDITKIREAESTLRKLSQAVEQSPNTVVITDIDANIEYANAAFSKVTGYSLEEVAGKNPRILQSGKTAKGVYDDMWTLLTAGKEWRGELINKRKDGSEYIESALISPVRQPDGKITHYLAIKQDITAKRRDEERIQQLAHFDQLTGLPNRALLQERFSYALSLAQRSNESLAVMFLDLDHFKDINDTLGHSIGDHFLIEVAKRLKESLRDEDTVSRLGGDEFILIIPGSDADAAAIVANKLIHAVSQPYRIEHHELIGTPSIGIALYPHDGNSLEDLLKNADTAMYRVKQESRNNFRFFTTEMQAHSERNLQIVNAMRHALTRNELYLQYQPQVILRDGHIVGAEALLRWDHPELGSISPAEFIPIAEESGQIIPIGEWVLRTAAQQMKVWLDVGLPPMVMAVNLSAIQFRQPNLPELVTRILEEVQLPPAHLELELTEAVAMDNPQSAIAVMDKLFDSGVRMSIDDFGTGYSSLSYLKRFKVNKLKIDQSFVRDISDDPEDKAIVTAIINLATSLGLHTIAEGVETASQLAFLRLQGCDEVQGYYFSKPLRAEEFEKFVRQSI